MLRRRNFPPHADASTGLPLVNPKLNGAPAYFDVEGMLAKTGQFPKRQIALLRTFADQAVISIENARLFEEVQARTRDLTRSIEELRALCDVARRSARLSMSQILRTVVEQATAMAYASGGAIYVFDKLKRSSNSRPATT